jgi:hypothetical protein
MKKVERLPIEKCEWVGTIELKKGIVMPKYRSVLVELRGQNGAYQKHDIFHPYFMGAIVHDYKIKTIEHQTNPPKIQCPGSKDLYLDLSSGDFKFKSVEVPLDMFSYDTEIVETKLKKINDYMWRIEKDIEGKKYHSHRSLSEVLGHVDSMLNIKEPWLPNFLVPVRD